MATIFVVLIDEIGAPITGASPTFDFWDKSSPGAPAATGQSMTELEGGIGGGYFADVPTTDGREYLAIIDGTAAASPRFQQVSFSGTTDTEDVVSATSTTVELAATESSIDNLLIRRYIVIVDGLGVGQIRVISAYDGTTKIATISRAWDITPDNTSDYRLLFSTEVDLTGDQQIQLQEAWTSLGMNENAPASFDFPGLFIRALANITPIEVVISVAGTTVTLTRQP